MARRWAPLLLCVLLLGDAALRALADDPGKDKERQEEERRAEDDKDRSKRQVSRREYKVEVKDYEVEIEGTVRDGSVRDKVEFQLTTKEDNGMRVKFSHKTKVDDSSSENVKFEVQILELLEYDPAVLGTPEFQPGHPNASAAVVQRWVINKNDWAKFSTALVDGVRQFQTTAGNGVLLVRGSVSEADAQLGGVPLDPNSLKLDIELHGYAYSPSHGASRLALKTAVKSIRVEAHDDDDRAGYEVRFKTPVTSQPGGRFRWAEEVAISGNTTVPVKAVVQNGTGDSEYRSWNYIYFSFLTPDDNAQPVDIVWDPTVGLDYTDVGASKTLLIVLLSVGGAAFVLLTVGSVLFYRRRRAGFQQLPTGN